MADADRGEQSPAEETDEIARAQAALTPPPLASTPAPQKPPAAPRALALDALRGLAIVGMCLSGVVPWGGLPSWMYHAQYVPIIGASGAPTLRFDGTHSGYTWVDLVFPAFLFSMGVAFPFALSSRLKKGVAMWRVVAGVLGRGAALVAFAIYVQHIAPFTMMGNPDVTTLLLALLGFFLLFPIFCRFPDSVDPRIVIACRALGIGGAIWLMATLRFPQTSSQGVNFSLYRSDIIILVLSNMAVWGSLIWLATRGSILWRLGAMGLVVAALEANKVSGSWVNLLLTPRLPEAWLPWFQEHLGMKDFAWAYRFDFCKYLLIVLPGTIIGELLMDWMTKPTKPGDHGRGSLPIGALSAFCVGLVVFAHVGLHARWTLATPPLLIATMAAGWWWISRYPVEVKTDVLLRHLYGWSIFWMILGLIYEPVAGGIKKDPSTMSYYFVSTSLSILLLISLTIWIDLYQKQSWFMILIRNGQNPMLAYVAIRNLLAPLVHLPIFGGRALETIAREILAGSLPIESVWRYWRIAIWSFAKTLWLAWVVGLFTRFRIIWRA
jgi:predicted acyltransferase